MEKRSRKPFEGVTNIIRFNWHFYVLAVLAAVTLLIMQRFVSPDLAVMILLLFWMLVISVVLSLAVSFYVYDISSLYKLTWLAPLHLPDTAQIVNINAGFDETSCLLAEKYPQATFTVLDFYDAKKHTEVSIARARKRQATYPDTVSISTSQVPLATASVDCIFCILSAHEIRNRQERISFFEQLGNSIAEAGYIVVVEHLRNLSNCIAYTIGFLHFFSRPEWERTFRKARLHVVNQASVTPFVHVFFLQKNGIAS